MLTDCLQGRRVLDMSQYIPGPFATQMLADLGAEVIKVEPPAGDPMRSFMLLDQDGISPFYKQINAAKTVVRIDLKTAGGRSAFEDLLSCADVLVESYRPGVMDRLSFDRSRIEQLNPRLVHCALSGFGQTGPYRLRAGHDLTYLALTGGLSVSGTGETPAITFPPVADHAGAMQAVTSILGALLRRERIGKGAHIDLSLFEAALSWQSMGLTAACRQGQEIERGRDLLTGGAACYQVYRTADGRFVALAALEEKFWRTFCEGVGRCDWIPRQSEALPQQELIGEVQALLASRDLAEWQGQLEGADCCFEPILNYAEVLELDHVRERRLVSSLGGADRAAEVAYPAWLDGAPPQSRAPLREQTAEEALSAWGP